MSQVVINLSNNQHRHRRGAVLAAAAAIIAVATIAALMLTGRGDDGSPVITDEPTITTENPATTTRPDAATNAVDPRDATGPRPVQMVATTEDGRLVVLDVATGNEVRELARAGAASDYRNAGSESFIDAVEVSPDRSTVYFSTCCEPAPGAMFRVPLDGSEEPVRLALDGAYPDVRPGAGDQIVVTNTIGVYAFELPVGTLNEPTGSEAQELAEASGNGSQPFWLGPTSLAFERFDPNQGSSIAVISDLDREPPTVTNLPTESGVGWEFPVGTEAAIIVAEQCCANPRYGDTATARVVDPSTGGILDSFDLDGPVADLDLSNNWLLVTYTDGELVQVDLSAETFPSVPLASGVENAAWVPPTAASTGEPTSLTESQARTAETEVRGFLDDLGRGDVDAAQDRLSNYLFLSAAELATDPVLSRLAHEDVVVTVTPSWSFSAPAPVVTASTGLDTDGGLVAAAFLVDPRHPGGPIHRVQTVDGTPEIDTTVAPGDQISIPGVPVEGGGRAFLGDLELPLDVDHDALEMRITYPPETTARILTISTATPELPTATAFVLEVTGCGTCRGE